MADTGRPKLLLVADDAAAIETARQLLEERGAILAAATVDRAVLHLDQPVDLIIALDVAPARILELLRLVQATPAGRGGVPVTFVDLARLRHRHGVLAADREVLRLVDWHRAAQAA